MNSTKEYVAHYSSLNNEDLLHLSHDMQSLDPNAREALRLVMPYRHLQVEDINQTAQPTSPDTRTTQVMTRYHEGYLHARTIDGFGGVIKVVSLLIGGLLVFGGFSACSTLAISLGEHIATGLGIGGVVIGLFLGSIGYIFGVLIQSAGQSMKAHFDCAVYQSHFLNDNQRAKVMSLE